MYIIIIIIIPCEFFTPALTDGLSLESEWFGPILELLQFEWSQLALRFSTPPATIIIIIIIIILWLAIFSLQLTLVVFHCSLSDRKSL